MEEEIWGLDRRLRETHRPDPSVSGENPEFPELQICSSFSSVGKLATGYKDTLVICNSTFFIFLNQIKAHKYSFKVISND
jgi:hypothetical protein